MPDKPDWIDFRELRKHLSFAEVLQHYNVELKIKGERASGFCPLPTHQGKRSSPSFSVHLVRGIWQCFGCHAKGNCLDFACRMEGLDPADPQQLRKAALRIRDVFLGGSESSTGSPKPDRSTTTGCQSGPKPLVNAPLDFELKELDPHHPYLKDRGFMSETIARFGLGYCNRGMLKGRVAIPLHDLEGRIVGYAGRLTKDSEISESNPKYRFPGDRERKGIHHEFRKSLLLYNAHRIQKPVDHLFIVEGFAACWWLDQAKYRNAVALMGSDCSDMQAEIIADLVKLDGKIWAMPDGDAAGAQCAKSILEKVSPHRFVRWVKLEANQQPTDIPADELVEVFGV